MTLRQFAMPRHWEDWFNVLLGLWLWLSPWALQFIEVDKAAAANAVLTGTFLVFTEAFILSAFEPWEEWISAAIGAWLLVSPWVLGITASLAWANFLVVGGLVLTLSVYEIWDEQRHGTRRAA
jgi:hypothetical protein